MPEVGVRYEWCDFIGATFIGTLAHYFTNDDGELELEFSDRQPFATNLPIAFRRPEGTA